MRDHQSNTEIFRFCQGSFTELVFFRVNRRLFLLTKSLILACLGVTLGALGGFTAEAAHAEPSKVVIGAYIHDIQNMDLKAHNYVVDFYLWFRWRDPKINPANTFELMNPSEAAWGHLISKAYENPITLSSGEFYNAVRLQGRFSNKFNLRNYPFDRQALTIEIEDKDSEASDILYVADAEDEIKMNPTVTFPGFELGAPKLSVRTQSHPTAFGGDPRAQIKQSEYTRAKIEIPIRRPILTYLLKLVLPILCVVFCAGLIFFFDPSYVDSRVGIGITSLLTIVALQITTSNDLPEIEYLILMDKIYLLSDVFVVSTLGIVVHDSWAYMTNAHNVKKIIRTDRRSAFVLVFVYLVTLGLLLFNAFR